LPQCHSVTNLSTYSAHCILFYHPCSGESRWQPVAQEWRGAATGWRSLYRREAAKDGCTYNPADKRRESTTGYWPLCVSSPGDSHCSDEISGLQVLNTLQHGTDDDDDWWDAASGTDCTANRK